MTDKQIIIDGVDVADCEHINACDKKMKCVILQDDVCETNPYCEGFNCYYKQLKRKEQECEEKDKSIKFLLKSLDNSYKMRDDCESHWDKERKELKQQLDQLKKQNDIMLSSLKKLQNKLCSSTSQCKYFLIDVLKEVENASK